jgi:2'-hydroxyisoflavone reductase
MKLLIIGGTVFLGRHVVESALRRGHQVTLFNRGQHNPELFPELNKIHGDRDGGLEPLAGKQWDAVIDTCGYVPRVVRASAEFLAISVEHYTFISSISVYAEPLPPGANESAMVGILKDTGVEQITGETYGPLKALCEQAVEKVYAERSLVIRPGLIVGPYDPSDRFTYWPSRVARGGEVLAPGKPERQTQIIDVRDLAEWTLEMIERRASGTYNATGPAAPLTLGSLLEACRQVTGSDAHFTWVCDEFLLKHKVTPYTELPLWMPEAEAAWEMVSIHKALGASLKFRPLEQTVRDTLEWDRTRPADVPRRNGLAPEREEDLLNKYRKK